MTENDELTALKAENERFKKVAKLVVAYDGTLRGLPGKILFEGDLIEVDAEYDAMVEAAIKALKGGAS